VRILLAFRVFFAILFGLPLPEEIMELPIKGNEERPKLDVAGARAALDEVNAPKPEPVAPPPPPPREPEKPKEEPRRVEDAAVQVLAVLQSEGRLLDFLSEDIESYADADIGAAVRDVHRGLRRALSDHFPVQPIRSEDEGAMLTVPEGFDPSQIRLVGNVVGKPPFSGRLKHKGWKVGEVRLPRIPSGDAARIAQPAEVEL
jgi:hypothetical protein